MNTNDERLFIKISITQLSMILLVKIFLWNSNVFLQNYIDKLQASEHWKDISYFEMNLETWRQLWRVLEMCDILLLIVDVRYAVRVFCLYCVLLPN